MRNALYDEHTFVVCILHDICKYSLHTIVRKIAKRNNICHQTKQRTNNNRIETGGKMKINICTSIAIEAKYIQPRNLGEANINLYALHVCVVNVLSRVCRGNPHFSSYHFRWFREYNPNSLCMFNTISCVWLWR